MWDSLEKVDLLHDRKKQMVCNAWTNCLWKIIQCFLLLQSFCFEPQTYMWQHLILNAMRQMISWSKFRSCFHCVPLWHQNQSYLSLGEEIKFLLSEWVFFLLERKWLVIAEAQHTMKLTGKLCKIWCFKYNTKMWGLQNI